MHISSFGTVHDPLPVPVNHSLDGPLDPKLRHSVIFSST